MSKKGGYKIVSLGGLDLTGENLALSGLYNALKLSHGKPILLTGIVIDGEKKKDALVQADEGANKINIKNLYGYDLEVAKSGDAITVTESPDGIELPVPEVADAGKIVGVNSQGKYALQDSVKKQVEDGAQAGTIQDALGLDSSGNLVKGNVSGSKIYQHKIDLNKGNSGSGAYLYIYDNDSTPVPNENGILNRFYSAIVTKIGNRDGTTNRYTVLGRDNSKYYYLKQNDGTITYLEVWEFVSDTVTVL